MPKPVTMSSINQRLPHEAPPQSTVVSRDRVWLGERINRGVNEMFVESVRMTPALAQTLLDINRRNRPVSKRVVKRYAKLMKDGRWLKTSQTISVAKTGDLNNGQHRLHGVVQAGVPVDMMIAFGETASAFAVLDNGKRRNPADAAAVVGHKNASLVASIARLVFLMETSGPMNDVENDDILRVLESRPKITEAARVADALRKKLGAPASGMAFGFLFIMEKRGSVPDEFLEPLADGFGMTSRHDPRLILRNKLTRNFQDPTVATYVRSWSTGAFIIKAFNAWLAGDEIQVLRWNKGETFPAVR